MEIRELFFGLLRIVICNESASESLRAACTPENLEAVYALAKKHDLAHLIGQAASTLDLPEGEALVKCKKAAMTAYGRYVRMEHDYRQVCQALEEAQIAFVPLKGAVMRSYYPEPWMRTSCDADILVKREQLDMAGKVLTEKLGYRFSGDTTHDISFYSPNNTHIELHFDLLEDGRANNASQQLSRAWDNVHLRQGYDFWYEMTDAFFYFYHIVHMAKHFENGGCGVRPFIDLWLLDQCAEKEQIQRDELLQTGRLLQFTTVARKLCRVWFCDETADWISENLQIFLLHGGVYGSASNYIILKKGKEKSWLKYLFDRVFASYEKLKTYYPILEKHRWLMPFMQIRRWFRLLKPNVLLKAKKEAEASRSMGNATGESGANLLEDLGLNPAAW